MTPMPTPSTATVLMPTPTLLFAPFTAPPHTTRDTSTNTNAPAVTHTPPLDQVPPTVAPPLDLDKLGEPPSTRRTTDDGRRTRVRRHMTTFAPNPQRTIADFVRSPTIPCFDDDGFGRQEALYGELCYRNLTLDITSPLLSGLTFISQAHIQRRGHPQWQYQCRQQSSTPTPSMLTPPIATAATRTTTPPTPPAPPISPTQ